MQEEDIKEINEIIFGIFSAKEVLDISVCEINNPKHDGANSVYDERLNPDVNSKKPCVSCKLAADVCPGHFCHISLNVNIIHPIPFIQKMVVSFLRCFCVNMECNKLLINKEQVDISGLLKFKKEKRFDKILKKLQKVEICCHCSHPHPKFMYYPADSSINMVYNEKIEDEHGKKKDKKSSIVMTVEEIKKNI